MPVNEPTDLYYILSPYGPCGNCASWWRIDGHGYSANLQEAWKVPLEMAKSICGMKRGDKAYPVEVIDTLSTRHLDTQLLRDVKQIQADENIRPADTGGQP